jgi:hypothetical protein
MEQRPKYPVPYGKLFVCCFALPYIGLFFRPSVGLGAAIAAVALWNVGQFIASRVKKHRIPPFTMQDFMMTTSVFLVIVISVIRLIW